MDCRIVTKTKTMMLLLETEPYLEMIYEYDHRTCSFGKYALCRKSHRRKLRSSNQRLSKSSSTGNSDVYINDLYFEDIDFGDLIFR